MVEFLQCMKKNSIKNLRNKYMISFIILLIIMYLFISFVFLNYQTNFDVSTMTPKDVWLALFWPILLVKIILKSIVTLLFYSVGFILLMFGCRYIQTDNFNYIANKIMDF